MIGQISRNNAVYNVDCRCTDGRTGVSFRVDDPDRTALPSAMADIGRRTVRVADAQRGRLEGVLESARAA